MTVEQLDTLREEAFLNDVPLRWIDPREVTGTDAEHSKQLNWQYHHAGDKDEEEYPDDDIIVEYLDMCLRQGVEEVSAIQLVEAVIYLITTYWSTAATTFLANWHKLLSIEVVDTCVSMMKEAFESNGKWAAKALLRDFVVDYFGSSNKQMEHLYPALSPENAEFIETMIQDRNHVFSFPPEHLKPPDM